MGRGRTAAAGALAASLLAALATADVALESGAFVYVEADGSVAPPAGADASLPPQARRSSAPLDEGTRNAAWLWNYRPAANPAAVVAHGPARFTVLTTGVVRMEWSPHAPPVFHDAGSFAVVNRWVDSPPVYTSNVDDRGVLTLDTADVTLVYDPAADDAAAGFTAANLRATIKGTGALWTPGTPASGSLHGTIRTLDRIGRPLSLACTQPSHMNDSHCEEGFASRDGWALVDDSLGPRWESYDQEWPWTTGPAERPPLASEPGTCTAQGWDRWECMWGNHPNEAACAAKGCCYDPGAAAAADGQPSNMHFVAWCWWPRPAAGKAMYTDWYLFAHGRDYTRALRDYALIGGRVPMLPRWELGPQYSRWFAYHDFEEREIAATFGRNGVPLDVVIVDMDWHDSYPRGVPDAPPGVPVEPWTGFTIWNATLPAPEALIAHLKRRGLRVMFNLHPHFGLQFYDEAYDELAAALGRTPADGAPKQPLLGDYTNFTYARAFYDIVLRRLDDVGVDALWVDWQAGEWTPVLGANPTAWLSYLHHSNPLRYGNTTAAVSGGGVRAGNALTDRPVVLNRWGGLGSHRYPVGFSGDADTAWEILRFQAYVTPTAANVAFQWSHDIGGFAGVPTPELMVRWAQFGVFSPILRPHTAGKSGANRDIWLFPFASFEILRDYFRLRSRLVPYLSRCQHEAYETGVVTVRPLYYSWPAAEDAYSEQAQHQYLFGPDVLVAPITAPAPAEPSFAGIAHSDVYLPPGDWIEWFSWEAVSGGAAGGPGITVNRGYALHEMPLFSRPGTILPLRGGLDALAPDLLGRSADTPDDLTLWVFPLAKRPTVADDPGCETEADPETVARHGPRPQAEGFTTIYDDDGVSTDYVHGAHMSTPVYCTYITGADEPPYNPDDWETYESDGLTVTRRREGTEPPPHYHADAVECEVGPATGGGYDGFPSERTYTFRFPGTHPPMLVTLNDDAMVPHDQDAAPADGWGDGARWRPHEAGWAYSAATASVWVRVGLPMPTDAAFKVRLTWEPHARVLGDALAVSGLPRLVARAQAAKSVLNAVAFEAHAVDTPSLYRALAVAPRVDAAGSYSSSAAHYGELRDQVAAAVGEVEALTTVHGVAGHVTERAAGLLRDALR